MYLMGGVDSGRNARTASLSSQSNAVCLGWLSTLFHSSSVINLFSVPSAKWWPWLLCRCNWDEVVQAVTIMVRALALGEVSWGDWRG